MKAAYSDCTFARSHAFEATERTSRNGPKRPTKVEASSTMSRFDRTCQASSCRSAQGEIQTPGA